MNGRRAACATIALGRIPPFRRRRTALSVSGARRRDFRDGCGRGGGARRLSDGAASHDELLARVDCASLRRRRGGADRRTVSLARDRRRTKRPEPLQEPPADFPLQSLVHEPDQPVQPVLPVLLRVRRGQGRDAGRQAEVHGPGDGEGLGGFSAGAIRGAQGGPHHFFRRRDADELPAAQAGGHLCDACRPPRRAARSISA